MGIETATWGRDFIQIVTRLVCIGIRLASHNVQKLYSITMWETQSEPASGNSMSHPFLANLGTRAAL